MLRTIQQNSDVRLLWTTVANHNNHYIASIYRNYNSNNNSKRTTQPLNKTLDERFGLGIRQRVTKKQYNNNKNADKTIEYIDIVLDDGGKRNNNDNIQYTNNTQQQNTQFIPSRSQAYNQRVRSQHRNNNFNNNDFKPPKLLATSPYELPTHETDPRAQYYITTNEECKRLIQQLQLSNIISIDTEFVDFPYYTPSLQCIQVATDNVLALIDIQLCTGNSIKQLLELLFSKLLVLHSSKLDIELLMKLATKHDCERILPTQVFDTQIACSMLGIANMISLKEMLVELLTIQLNKNETLTDWTQRPLNTNQINYALNDVRYLEQCKNILEKRLYENKRYELFALEMNKLCDQVTYQPADVNEIWRTIHQCRKLESKSVELTILRNLCIWREKLAKSIDWSPNALFKKDTMFAISLLKPKRVDELYTLQNIKRTVISKHGAEILNIVNDSINTPVEDRPVHKFDARDSDRLNFALAAMLSSYASSKATQIKINVFVLADRKDINEIASCSMQAIQTVLDIKLEQLDKIEKLAAKEVPVNDIDISTNTTTTSATASVVEPITSEIYKQKPDVSVQREIEVLLSLPVLNDWRLTSIGIELLQIATGRPIQWNNKTNEVEFSDDKNEIVNNYTTQNVIMA